MLIQLTLKNIALIEIIEINFEKGLNIFTGDSGSGKSLILDSLNVLFGGTNIPLKHLIRPGKQNCSIEATFTSSPKVNEWLINNGFDKTLEEFSVVRKSYIRNKKIVSKYILNNLIINKKLLSELGLLLIDFAGQSDTFLFECQEYRRLLIDELGSKQLKAINLEIKEKWEEFTTLRRIRDEKMQSIKNKEQKTLAIKEMFKILEEANLNSDDEITELKSKELRLSNNFDINNAMQLSLSNLSNSTSEVSSVSILISESIKHLNKIVSFDPKIQHLKDNLINIQNEVENLIFGIAEYLEQVENEDIGLQEIQTRLFFLQNLERTFSLDLPNLILKREELKQYMDVNSHADEIQRLNIQINTLQCNLDNLLSAQTFERRQTANQLQKSVIDILKNLGLENAKFLIDFIKIPPSAEGNNHIDFLFSANPDQKLAPLSKVISGGEMSRFLLAVKASISKQSNTFFLDEIDNGLSGKSLFSLVKLIKEISKDQQVICITHQPFLAARGLAHFKVNKKVIDGITYTSILKLTTKKQRKDELIELIGGGSSEVNEYASRLLDLPAA